CFAVINPFALQLSGDEVLYGDFAPCQFVFGDDDGNGNLEMVGMTELIAHAHLLLLDEIGFGANAARAQFRGDLKRNASGNITKTYDKGLRSGFMFGDDSKLPERGHEPVE